ncbi:LEA domain protein [Cordyceps fumosorosea ARSEF 2679]|uniref:LEA domain protein n=1 Tax=Cordyceps fumosorosea (strain ARSEF 2679) TaxID=1081104 RepID=A0A167WNQ9_CORFA|nr:LEA domain protein [Cordyceps fumosorosea ARSEF 2679]OAA64021.1 LEA domain protein [Cordyceps fumosorosea ARSEF 2679]
MYADISQPPAPLPSAPLQRLATGISLQPPLTRRGFGPGLIILTTGDEYDEEVTHRDDAPTPVLKWAEEGYAVVQISAAAIASSGAEKASSVAVQALNRCDACKPKDKVGIVCYSSSLWNLTAPALDSAAPGIAAAVIYGDDENTESLSSPSTVPSLRHIAGAAVKEPKAPKLGVKEYQYPTVKGRRRWFSPGHADFDYSADSVAHTRSLQFLKPKMDGPLFDLESIWEEHTYYEFADRSVEHTMSTMVQEPYVNHVPTLTGGIGRLKLTDFYRHNFIFNNSADTSLELVSRTIGIDRVIDEFIFKFTHDREIDWLLPGVPPTHRKAEVPFVAVVNIRGDRLYHEHIAWDQGTTLRQLGLMPDHLPFPYPVAGAPDGARVEYRVPVLGRETADKLRDRKTVPSNEMFQFRVRINGE